MMNMGKEELRERLDELVDFGRNIQAEIGGDSDYRKAAEKDAKEAVEKLLADLGY
jgi:hypothetical protein